MAVCEHCKKAGHCRADAEADQAKQSPVTRLANFRRALEHPDAFTPEDVHHMQQSATGLEITLTRIEERRRRKKREYGCTAIE